MDTGRPIYIGDGVIPQVERFASKYAFNNFTIQVFQAAMSAMAEKAEQPTGNHWIFICNERMWSLVQNILGEYLSRFKPNTAYMYSKAKNGYLDVGATFQSYEFGGNSIMFKVDRTFSREYGMEKGYALMLDLTADKSTGEPAMQMFTLKGGDFITNRFPKQIYAGE